MKNEAGAARRSAILEWTAHHSIKLLIGYVVFGSLGRLLGYGHPSMLLYLLVLACFYFLNRRHERSLCLHCVRVLPLNPQAQVEAKRNRLVLVHRYLRPRYIFALSATILILHWLGYGWLVDSAMSTVGMVLVIYVLISVETHTRLQPWCPMCRDGGEGGEDVGAPGPVPVNRSRLPR